MRKIPGWKVLALVLCTVAILTSCGLKGDLYLPEGQANAVKVS